MHCLFPYLKSQVRPPDEPSIIQSRHDCKISIFTSPNKLEDKIDKLKDRIRNHLNNSNATIQAVSQPLGRNRIGIIISSKIPYPVPKISSWKRLLANQELSLDSSRSISPPQKNQAKPSCQSALSPSKSPPPPRAVSYPFTQISSSKRELQASPKTPPGPPFFEYSPLKETSPIPPPSLTSIQSHYSTPFKSLERNQLTQKRYEKL